MQVPKCLRNSCLGSFDCLLIDFYDIMTWSYVSSCLKVLEVFNLKIQNQAKLYAQFYSTHSGAILMKTRHIAILCIVSFLRLSASKGVLIDSSQWDHSRTRPSTRIHEMWLHPLKRKKRMNKIHSLSQKKREKGEVCNAMHQTTMEYIFIYHLHLTHEMSI